jgi:hypothetical protein
MTIERYDRDFENPEFNPMHPKGWVYAAVPSSLRFPIFVPSPVDENARENGITGSGET